jgi:hypothetical protein
MTRAEILAMPAGPEMDALVAERLGIECLHSNWESYDRPENELSRVYSGRDVRCVACGETSVIPFSMNAVITFGPREYSTDIAAAWDVVDSLPDKIGGEGVIGFQVRREARNQWLAGYADVEPYEGEGWHLSVEASTAPLAICRAALLATLE